MQNRAIAYPPNIIMDRDLEKKQQGIRFSEWLSKVTAEPRTGQAAKAADISRVTGISNTRIAVLLKNCVTSDGLVSLPRAPTIERIAEKYQADANEGKVIVGLVPKKSASTVFIPDPRSQKFELSTGETIFSRPDDPDAARRAGLIDAYLVGLQAGTEQRD